MYLSQVVLTRVYHLDNTISKHGGIIDVNVAVEIEAELQAIVDLLVQLCVDIKVDIDLGVSVKDISNCGNTFILLVNLLVTVLLKIFNACQSGKWHVLVLSLMPRYKLWMWFANLTFTGAIAILVSVVVKLQVQIQLCLSLILGCINGLIGGLLGLVLNLLLKLKVDINVCISVFLSTCGKFH